MYDRQYGAAYGTPMFAGGGNAVGAGANVNFSGGLNASVGTGSAQVSGFVVIVFLALAWIGYHGLKG
jgi:hypothetical protein